MTVDLLITGGTIVDGTGNPGYRASLAVAQEIVDFDQIRPVGTYDNTRRQCRGIEYVIVYGTTVIDRGRHTGAHPDRARRGSAR